jgi:hypothetical protein
LKHNLKNFPDVHNWFYRKAVHDWKEAFEKKFKEIDFDKWYQENITNIMIRFDLHSHSGIMPHEVLQYFVEKEILGEDKE